METYNFNLCQKPSPNRKRKSITCRNDCKLGPFIQDCHAKGRMAIAARTTEHDASSNDTRQSNDTPSIKKDGPTVRFCAEKKAPYSNINKQTNSASHKSSTWVGPCGYRSFLEQYTTLVEIGFRTGHQFFHLVNVSVLVMPVVERWKQLRRALVTSFSGYYWYY